MGFVLREYETRVEMTFSLESSQKPDKPVYGPQIQYQVLSKTHLLKNNPPGGPKNGSKSTFLPFGIILQELTSIFH